MAVTHNMVFSINSITYTIQSDFITGSGMLYNPPANVATLAQHENFMQFTELIAKLGDRFGAVITSLSATWNATIFDLELVANGTTYSFHSDLSITATPSIINDTDTIDTKCLVTIARTVEKIAAIGRGFGFVITSLNITAI